jgi:hypothetical protein
MSDHTHKPLDKRCKSRFTAVCFAEIHISPSLPMPESQPVTDSNRTSPATF